MKLTLWIFFLLLPFFADCQINERNTAPQSGADSIITPSLNREWAAPEFLDVFNNIIARQGDAPADVISIDRNRNLFAKLTNISNYWFFESNAHTLNERINFSRALYGPVKTIFYNYYQKGRKVNGQMKYDREIAAFFDLLFELSESQMKMIDEFIKITPDLTQAQSDGYKKMIEGYTTMEAGALITIEKEYVVFSEASICKMTRSFSNFYSFMYSKIDQDTKTEFDKRIADMIKTHPVQCVRTELQAKR